MDPIARAIADSRVLVTSEGRPIRSRAQALQGFAKLFLKAGAHAVKIERKPEIAEFLVKNGIYVMGHVGLTPQTITSFKVQGKDEETSNRIFEEAKSMDKAGCFSLVLECIPRQLAKKITEVISIPTIGIGAGPDAGVEAGLAGPAFVR